MSKLQISRYGKPSPVMITDSGCAVSVPIYLQPSNDSKKAALNRFREIRTQQLIEMGHLTPSTSSFGVDVIDHSDAPLTAIETELGMNESALRAVLFSRSGIQEVTIMKLSRLTGHVFCTREDVEKTYSLWLDELYGPKTNKGRKKTADSNPKTEQKS